MHIRIILEIFEKCKFWGTAFYFQSSSCISNEPPCLKTTGYMMTFYFYLVCFNFSISCSVLHVLVSFSLCFPVSPSFFFFFDVLSQAFIKHSRKTLVYIYIYRLYNIYILENIWYFCLAKTLITFCLHLFDLVWIECYISNLYSFKTLT